MKTSYLFLAEGFEEIEALATVDILRRAGIEVRTVSVTDEINVVGAHGIEVSADELLEFVIGEEMEWIIIPGGMPGASNLASCRELTDKILAHNSRGGRIAAICAAPAVVLAPLGLLDGKEAICYPGFESAMKGTRIAEKPVVVCDNIITANGPGSAPAFALEIVSQTLEVAKAQTVAEGMLIK